MRSAMASLIIGLLLVGCGSTTQQTATIKTVALNVDFNTAAKIAVSLFSVSPHRWLANFSGSCSAGQTTDEPGTTAGLDCDNDGGKVAYQTPTQYKIALKGVYLIKDTGEKSYLFSYSNLKDFDADGIKTFTSANATVALPTTAIGNGVVATGIGFEIYYLQLKIKMYGTDREIRIYMSDDDFTSENSRGHHQGDITYFDNSSVEHWAYGGANWFSNASTTLTRGTFANGVGGTDPQTGHARGMFGNAALWNNLNFAQGATQDIYYDSVNLSGSGSDLTIKFGIANTWFYEDFETSTYPNSFDPCQSSSLEGCGGEWAPLSPSVSESN